mmetsp:Transcript_80622/g.215997  ORF Transcript_80622/g.215997 Transcript_80622/m.215997 type:complete len:277 (-) Transcript_80622:738-1568(-)
MQALCVCLHTPLHPSPPTRSPTRAQINTSGEVVGRGPGLRDRRLAALDGGEEVPVHHRRGLEVRRLAPVRRAKLHEVGVEWIPTGILDDQRVTRAARGEDVAAVVHVLLEGGRRLAASHGLHDGVADEDRHVAARETIRHPHQFLVFVQRELGRRLQLAQLDLQQRPPRVHIGERDVDAPLAPPAHRRVDAPREVGGAQHQHAVERVAETVHLHEQLRLDASRALALRVAAHRGDGVDLVDEDDGGLVLARHGEELAHQLLALAQPLAGEVGGADG